MLRKFVLFVALAGTPAFAFDPSYECRRINPDELAACELALLNARVTSLVETVERLDDIISNALT